MTTWAVSRRACEADLPSLEGRAVVVVTQSSWDELPRIRHQVARQMARFTRVFFVQTPPKWWPLTGTSIREVAPNITAVSLGNRQPIPRRVHLLLDPLKSILHRGYLRDIAALPGLGRDPVLINFNYDFSEAMDDPLFALKVYYCNDEFTTWASSPSATRAIIRREKATASAADLCLTVSTPLTEKLAVWNDRTETLLPGHEFAESRPRPRREGATRIGLMGFIDDRVHFDWLLAAAAMEDVELHLVGPIHSTDADIVRLRALPNVVCHGPRIGPDMQRILEDMDVLVMPYRAVRESGMLAASAPNKLFIYLAAAKPIVTSALPALVDLNEGLLYRASNAEEFRDEIRRAVEDDSDALRERRLAIARENTWNRRGDRLRELLERELARRNGGSRGAALG